MPVTTGAIIGGIGALGKVFMGVKQNNLANQINPQYVPYQKNQFATQYLGAAQNLYNSRMPGAANFTANIQKSQADQIAKIQRNATDSSTLLALGSATQGQSNQAYSDLLGKEGQFKSGMLGQLGNATQMEISEGDKVYKDMLTKYQLDSQAQAALRQSGTNNIFGGVSDIAGGLMQYGNYQNAAGANTNAADYNKILKAKYGL